MSLFTTLNSYSLQSSDSVAFYYGNIWPVEELHAFNVVVVEPSSGAEPRKFDSNFSKLYAYVSIGEVDKDASYVKDIKKTWILGKNDNWNSDVLDLTNPEYHKFVLEKMIGPLWNKGFQGFFFDTLDSYQLTKKSPKEQVKGLAKLIEKIHKKYPKAKLIFNRGFEVLPIVHEYVEAVAAESLFASWDNSKQNYTKVSEKNRTWLLQKLQEVKRNYKIPVIAIDYLPESAKEESFELAKKISSYGIIPWVANGYLTNVGVSNVKIIPRKIIILIDIDKDARSFDADNYQFTAFPLNYMGYVTKYYNTRTNSPPEIVDGTVAGVVTWFNSEIVKNPKGTEKFLTKYFNQNVPIVFLNYLGLPENSKLLKQLGFVFNKKVQDTQKVELTHIDKIFNYEIKRQPNILEFMPLKVKNSTPLVNIRNNHGEDEEASAYTTFGGYALKPFSTTSLPSGQERWAVNPFVFLKKALNLPTIPIPDITTVNGRRILMVHVDGDAFISRVTWANDSFTGELLLDDILKKYKIPTTISFIEREFEIIKPNKKAYKKLLKTAKETARLPWVKLATHTYSHPFEWGELVEGKENEKLIAYPDPNYKFSFEKEIVGSSNFINKNIAPGDKKTKIVFWSGDTAITEKPLKIAYENGIYNLNGMASLYTKDAKSIANLSAFGQFVGKYFHVFSPVANDFSYTDNWTPPTYRFVNVIETFELTDKPVRYKPISIYYHFYSAAEQGAFRSLKKIYKWAMGQETTPIHIIDYIEKVLAFNKLVIAEKINGNFLVTNFNTLREYRSPIEIGEPIVSIKDNVLGFTRINDSYYTHLGNKDYAVIAYGKNDKLYVKEANADLISLEETTTNTYRLIFRGYVPFAFKLGNAQNCEVWFNKKILLPNNEGLYQLQRELSGEIKIQCH